MTKSERISTLIMAIILICGIAMALTSCTISIIQTDTHGTATDVVDSDPHTEADVSPDINLQGIPI